MGRAFYIDSLYQIKKSWKLNFHGIDISRVMATYEIKFINYAITLRALCSYFYLCEFETEISDGLFVAPPHTIFPTHSAICRSSSVFISTASYLLTKWI